MLRYSPGPLYRLPRAKGRSAACVRRPSSAKRIRGTGETHSSGGTCSSNPLHVAGIGPLSIQRHSPSLNPPTEVLRSSNISAIIRRDVPCGLILTSPGAGRTDKDGGACSSVGFGDTGIGESCSCGSSCSEAAGDFLCVWCIGVSGMAAGILGNTKTAPAGILLSGRGVARVLGPSLPGTVGVRRKGFGGMGGFCRAGGF